MTPTVNELTQDLIRISCQLTVLLSGPGADEYKTDAFRKEFSDLIARLKSGEEGARVDALTQIAARIPAELLNALDPAVFDEPEALVRRLVESREAIGRSIGLVRVLFLEANPPPIPSRKAASNL